MASITTCSVRWWRNSDRTKRSHFGCVLCDRGTRSATVILPSRMLQTISSGTIGCWSRCSFMEFGWGIGRRARAAAKGPDLSDHWVASTSCELRRPSVSCDRVALMPAVFRLSAPKAAIISRPQPVDRDEARHRGRPHIPAPASRRPALLRPNCFSDRGRASLGSSNSPSGGLRLFTVVRQFLSAVSLALTDAFTTLKSMVKARAPTRVWAA